MAAGEDSAKKLQEANARLLKENRELKSQIAAKQGASTQNENDQAQTAFNHDEVLKERRGELEEVIRQLKEKLQECKQSEKLLQASEKQFRLLFETSRDPFIQVSMDGYITDFNDVFCQMLGYSAEELKRRTYKELTPEKWHQMEERLVREQILTRGYSEVYEKEYRRKDGSIIPVELRTILSRDENGNPNAMWAIVRDRTAQKRAEEKIREAQERLKLLSDNLPEGALYQYTYEANGKIRFLYISAGIERLNGVRVEDVLGDPEVLFRQIPRASKGYRGI